MEKNHTKATNENLPCSKIIKKKVFTSGSWAGSSGSGSWTFFAHWDLEGALFGIWENCTFATKMSNSFFSGG